jgi:hypothetical protein
MADIKKIQFPWYGIVAGETPLEQGDFLDNFPTPIPHFDTLTSSVIEGQKIQGKVIIKTLNMVVLTQSCDFQDLGDDDQVILCPRFDYLSLFTVHTDWKPKDIWKRLLKGDIINLHLLNKSDIDFSKFDYQVVTFNEIYSIPYRFIKNESLTQPKRIRLLPPFREHLAQAFARRFMRIGIPSDSELPKENPY